MSRQLVGLIFFIFLSFGLLGISRIIAIMDKERKRENIVVPLYYIGSLFLFGLGLYIAFWLQEIANKGG